jgi:hypothetical protein
MVARVVDEAEADLGVFVAAVQDRLLARIEAAHGGLPAGFGEALRHGVFATVRDALARLRSRAELPGELPPGLVELARVWAGSGCEPAELAADAWLVGQEVFWDRFQVMAERTLGDTALCWDVIKAARFQLGGYAARVSALFRGASEGECARSGGENGDGRLGVVLRALDGHWVDSGELGYDLATHHVAVVADGSLPLDELARRSERRFLSARAPEGEVWGWLGGRAPISDRDLDALVAWQAAQDGQVAFGEPATGIAGFAASHRQAREARRIASATGQRSVRFGDLRLLVAVLRDGELAQGLIERELGELARPSERMRELRATLRAFLEHSQSVSATAALRRRDRKTIQRQLRSAERLIHHRVCDRTDELLIALRVTDILRGGSGQPA